MTYSSSPQLTEELFHEMLTRVSNGELLYAICKDKHMPPISAFHRMFIDFPETKQKYDQAKELGVHAIAEEAVYIADTDFSEVQRVKLRTQMRQWYVAKAAPQYYGDVSKDPKQGMLDLVAAIKRAKARVEKGVTVDGETAQLDNQSVADIEQEIQYSTIPTGDRV